MRKIRNTLGRNFKKRRASDTLSKKKRSSLMSKIRSESTVFEQNFINELRKRTRHKMLLNVRVIKGKPDIVFDKHVLCVFLDSDFWHGWQYPRWRHLLKSEFWRKKIENNRRRDLRVTQYLRSQGWLVVRIWEHSIKQNKEKALQKILLALNRKSGS